MDKDQLDAITEGNKKIVTKCEKGKWGTEIASKIILVKIIHHIKDYIVKTKF